MSTDSPVNAVNLNDRKLFIGWREWAGLPALNVPAIKVKVDTGAKTSALHVFDLETVRQDSIDYVRFNVHPVQKNDAISQSCFVPVIDERIIKSSNGQEESRIIISTPVNFGDIEWDIEVGLTNRDIMSFRMLLGRSAMSAVIIDPVQSFCQGKITKKEIMKMYHKIEGQQ